MRFNQIASKMLGLALCALLTFPSMLTAGDPGARSANYPPCTSAEARESFQRVFNNSPMARTFNLTAIDVVDQEEVVKSADGKKLVCAGTLVLNSAENIRYRFTYTPARDGQFYIEGQPEEESEKRGVPGTAAEQKQVMAFVSDRFLSQMTTCGSTTLFKSGWVDVSSEEIIEASGWKWGVWDKQGGHFRKGAVAVEKGTEVDRLNGRPFIGRFGWSADAFRVFITKGPLANKKRWSEWMELKAPIQYEVEFVKGELVMDGILQRKFSKIACDEVPRE